MIVLINRHRWKVAYIMSLLFFISLFEPLLAMDKSLWQHKQYSPGPVNTPDRGLSPFEMEDKPIKVNEYKEALPPDDIDIDGPGQPEMKSFQSVNANNMVDLFTGDFSYNIPLLDVEGYGVALHYSSGITMDQEASWVGLGWNINPGSISRSLRGLPDDFDGYNDSLKKTQSIRVNRTTGVTVEPSLEIVGLPALNAARLGVFYNNYNGYGIETGVGIGGTGKSCFSFLTAKLSISNNSQQGITISPSLSATLGKKNEQDQSYGTLGISTGYSSRGGLTSLQLNGGKNSALDKDQAKIPFLSGSANFPFASISFATPSHTPKVNMPVKTSSFSFTGKVGHEKWAVVPAVSFTGYTNSQIIAPEDMTQTIPAAGYIYSTNGNDRENVVLDFNREKDGEFDYKSTPHIALPQYTYDAYNISGEGIGGTFRPYRGDIGYIFDHNIASRSSSENGSFDLGLGNVVHIGLEVTFVTTNNTNHRWNKANNIESKLRFQSADTTYEPVYFRNPGEKAINAQSYYRSIGDDSLIRIKLGGGGAGVFAQSSFVKYDDEGKMHADVPVTETLGKKQRDKRTQVISYFTAEDAAILGLDKQIKSYKENTVPLGKCTDSITYIPRIDGKVRKKNHLSEISVLNSDGRKYVYGLPANNVLQRDVTFAVDTGSGTPDPNMGLTPYETGDNSTGNTRGKDHSFSADEMPSYTHNFLLTGIVSPDYVDITGNGISEDDPGDAIRFNYSQVYGDATSNGYYKWRTPFQQDTANYNEGFKTYNRDDRATYLYGEKEIWYLNSIESKTMIAVFRLANDRQDGYSVLGENGGINTAKATRRLDRIDLYVKADLVKKGLTNARPVKTVHFEYNYELCKGAYGIYSVGKLTLKKVWFTYNKNNKGKLNPYIFSYHPDTEDNPVASYNPSYNPSHSDRWGTYKHKGANPDQMTNADYPYSTQNKDTADRNASVWSLTDIRLPSGGKIHVTYEADDYAYVQNKRATQMVTLAGINTSSGDRLYSSAFDKSDYYTIYINTPDVLKNKADLRNKYLAIDDVVYFKLAVTMPTDEFGGGYEMVPGYATIEDYGITPGNNQQFWIRLAPVEGRSPMTRAALQYLRLNLKSKAYPNSEGIENLGLVELIKMLATSITEVKNMVQGFDGAAKSNDFCSHVDLDRSFIRLSNPNYKKYGGGYRVKRVQVYDNWKKMTNQRESVYGQDYIYTTTEDVNGEKKTISSGVATYEPAIGGEENPFRRPINYSEKVAPMAPVNFMFSEEPLGESYFPSPMVGYSKVRVRTIHTKAKSANGWTESEYYTSRDFPTKVEHTLLENGVSKFKYETQSNLLRLNHKNYVTLSQGFRVELNDMNGKMKAQSTYAETDSVNPIAYSLNFYKVDDDRSTLKHLNNDVWVVDSANGNVNTNGQIGKDIEVMVDLRENRSLAHTRGFSPNVDVIAPFIPPFVPVLYLPSKVNLPQKEDVRFRSAAVVKIVQRYGILDSVVVMDKGSVVSTKNLVYDGETGNVVLSRTNNDFNDPVYNFNYPAYWAYSGMEPAYKNIGAVFVAPFSSPGYALNKGRLFQKGSQELFPMKRFFESGDEVYVYEATLSEPNSNDCRFLTEQGGKWKGKLWVIDAGKGLQKDSGLYFIDSLGRTAPSMIINKMVIVRSGKRNLQDVSAGSVVMLNSPLKELGGGRIKIVIDSTTRVLNASAATFKDMWKVENSEYQVDSCYVLLDTVSNKRVPALIGSRVFRKSFLKLKNSATSYELGSIDNSNYAASAYKRNRDGNRYLQYNAKSILRLPNLNDSIPSSATVISATLKLKAMAPRFIWEGLPNESYLSDFPSRTKAHFNNGDNTDNGTTYTNESVISSALAWSNSLPFDVVQGGTTKVSVSTKSDFSCTDDTTINVTPLIAVMVNYPATNHGLLMDIKDWGHYHEHNSSDRTQSYCARQIHEGLGSVEGGCLECKTAILNVTYSYYKDTCVKICRNNISDTAINPYRWGILGNWRMERSYVYYYDREETDATVKETNIRREGTLKNFIPYWSFTPTGIVPITDSSRWIWNSATSAFNRKGLEIENYDALGRFNAGLYGYNQTLPVAVVQNSRYRELLYDGFEDYGYKTAECIDCPPKREFDFVKGNTGVDTTQLQSHTGLYSLKINNGSEALLTVDVDSVTANTEQQLSAAIDSTEIFSSIVTGTGTGLQGRYTMGTRFRAGFNSYCHPSGGSVSTHTDATINFNWSSGAPMSAGPGGCSDAYSVTWQGTIQPRYTDIYNFFFRFNGTASISINNQNIFPVARDQTGERRSNDITLQAGRLYSISITYTKSMAVPHGPVELSWSSRTYQSREIIPGSFLYPTTPALADTAGSITYNLQYYCVQGDTVKPIHPIRDKFSPLTKTNLTVSAWVRLDVEDCNNTPALDSAIQVSFTGSSTTAWLKKTGLRIEGWQRYEANVNVPEDADSIYLRLKTLASVGIYVDDIRVQPFNSSMKSFVYNPVNLRLMAQLDENNYASFYEYDDDGTLIRVKKETERGIMTVQETRSALLKEQ